MVLLFFNQPMFKTNTICKSTTGNTTHHFASALAILFASLLCCRSVSASSLLSLCASSCSLSVCLSLPHYKSQANDLDYIANERYFWLTKRVAIFFFQNRITEFPFLYLFFYFFYFLFYELHTPLCVLTNILH